MSTAVDPFELISAIRRDPWWFIKTWFGDEPAIPKSREVLEALRDHDEVFVPACYDSTKTWTATAAMFWFLFAYPGDSIVVTTAPTWPQVEDQIWREAQGFWAHQKRKLGGRILKTQLEFGPKWYAIGKSSDNPVNFQGYHASNILVIIDEADGIEKPIIDAMRDGLLTSAGAKLLMIGNPLNPKSEFRRLHDAAQSDPRAHVMRIEADDVLPYSADKPYLLQQKWVDKKLAEWGGPSSMLAQAKIFARWPKVSADALIDIGWLLAAKRREAERGIRLYGADIARYGGNKTIRTLLEGDQLVFQHAAQMEDTVATTNRIISDYQAYQPAMLAIDNTGIGGGVVDQVRAYFRRRNVVNVPVLAVDNGAAPKDATRFANRGSEMYWKVREGFEAGRYGLAGAEVEDEDGLDALINDLARPTYSITEAKGKITVHKFGRQALESKMTVEQRQDESPDYGDSFTLAANAAEPYVMARRKTFTASRSYLPPTRPGGVSV